MKFNVDEKLYNHPKWRGLSSGAQSLWVAAGAWTVHNRSDGVVPTYVLAALNKRPASARQLVEAGLWETHPEGWKFHDWEKYNLTRAKIAEQAERNRRNVANSRRRASMKRGEHP